MCLAIEDDMDTTPLNLGMIAAYYYINYTTIELFSLSLTPKTKMKGTSLLFPTTPHLTPLPFRYH